MRASDPRVLWNAGLVAGLFWFEIWHAFVVDLLPGADDAD